MTKAEWKEVRTKALAALNGTLDRAVDSYSVPGGFNISAMNPDQLQKLIAKADNAIERKDRGGRLGKASFVGPS